MTDENRHRIFIVLSMALIIGWYAFVMPPRKPHKPPEKPAEAAQTADAGSAGQEAAEGELVAGAKPAAIEPAQAPTAVETEIRIDTPLYTAVLSNRGGVIREFLLKDYQSDDRSGPKNMVSPAATALPLFAELKGYLPAESGDALVYSFDGSESLTLAAGETATLRLSHRDSTGTEIIKTVTFNSSNYAVKADYRIVASEGDRTRYRPVFIQGLDNARIPPADTARMGTHAVIGADGIHRHEFKDIREKPVVAGADVQFGGFEDHYFLSAAIPGNTKFTTLRVQNPRDQHWTVSVEGPEILPDISENNAEVSGVTFYLGPKNVPALMAVNPVLETSINYGFGQTVIKPVAKFLVALLRVLYGYTADWGLAILMLTVIVRIALFPLAIKQFHSMQAMAQLKPKMEAIKEKYKDDKLAQNQATMELFREHKVNPLSGCLPILPQMPIFLGLYVALDTSLELRHAVFAGTWIHDLAIHDPYYILPIVTCVTMAISMKLTPSQMDPTQQKVMMIMPIVMFFLFMKIAAGLVLYWSASNIFSIVQQLYFNRRNRLAQAQSAGNPGGMVVETTATEVTASGGGRKKQKKLKG